MANFSRSVLPREPKTKRPLHFTKSHFAEHCWREMGSRGRMLIQQQDAIRAAQEAFDQWFKKYKRSESQDEQPLWDTNLT